MSSKRAQLPATVTFVLALQILGTVGILAALLARQQHTKPVLDTVRNTGSHTLGSVVLYVAGTRTRFSYDLGNILAGASAKTAVRAAEQSHLEIEFIDAHGDLKRVSGKRAFGPISRGRIDLSIREGAIETEDWKDRCDWGGEKATGS